MKIKAQEKIPLSICIQISSPQFELSACTLDRFCFPREAVFEK